MSDHHSKGNCSNVVSLLVLEGDTESVFYPLIRDRFLRGIRVELRQVHSGGNINKQVLSKIFTYTYNNPGNLVRVYCCSDTDRNELRATPLDIGYVRELVKSNQMTNVLSVDAIMADPEIEAWFFYDIEGIYGFLGAKKSKRNPRKYKNAGNLGREELQRLFEQFQKTYVPGNRAENFINRLDLSKIVNFCKELREGIELIKARARDTRSHIIRGG